MKNYVHLIYAINPNSGEFKTLIGVLPHIEGSEGSIILEQNIKELVNQYARQTVELEYIKEMGKFFLYRGEIVKVFSLKVELGTLIESIF